jgi:CO/xanthine dehydrogenase Mo-binding subunit
VTGLIGKSVRRSDGEAKVTGAAVYAIDYEEPRLLHAKLLRSPVAAGRIVRLDTSRAETMPGVRAVITGKDAPALGGFRIRDTPLMALDVVRYVGEPVAAVAADTVAQARTAANAIELEIEPLPAVTDIESALAPGAPLVHERWEDYDEGGPDCLRHGNVLWEASAHHSDLDAAFARDDVVVVEDEFESHRQHQAYIEPKACVVRYENGRFVVHSATQWAYQVRKTVSDYVGVRPADVRVIITTVGGGFGGKLDPMLEPFAALLARKSGRPVKLVNTRKDEFVSCACRENGIVRIRSAVTRDGEIVGREAVCFMDAGAYGGDTPYLTSVGAQTLGGNYRVGSARLVTQAVYTNTPPTGAFRGVSGLYCIFALERHMDHIAREIGMDRRELRLRNVIRDGDYGPTGQRFDDVALLDGLERVEEVAPWSEVSQSRPNRGVGLACVTWLTNAGPGGVALKLNEDGTVSVITAAAECGTGAITQGVTQIVAESLGVEPADVVLMPSDTDAGPYDMGAAGSRTTVAVGSAARIAADEVREQVLRAASDLLEIAPGDLELAEGTVRAKGAADTAVPLGEVATAATWSTGPITGHGSYNQDPVPFNAACSVGNLLPAFAQASYHVHLCEVEVDPETGKVEVLRYVVAQDVGKAINPRAVIGQIEGGVVQGLGYALYEDLRIDESGRFLEDRLEVFRLPTALDAPPIEAILVEGHSSPGPFGAKGVAEPPIIPVAAVVANAISDAIGKPIDRLPATPFAVLAAIRGEPEAGRSPPRPWSWRETTINPEPPVAVVLAPS